MIVNKKLDRFRQWAGEKMGEEKRTNVTEQFKSLEQEMELRQKGMERMQESMSTYMKAVSKRTDSERKEKNLPIACLGSSMIAHGEDFEHDSEFGQCLTAFGRTQERLARSQETYIIEGTNSWLESLDRSLVQMKEYQLARKKLESRRLAYDTSLTKMQKAKREDFRVEEELRSQQAKYEDAEMDVERRMQDIKDAEAESVTDLTAFLEAQLAYHDRCREALVQLRDSWPVQASRARPNPRSRSNTTRSFLNMPIREHDEPEPVVRPSIKSNNRSISGRFTEEPEPESEYEERRYTRPGLNRSTTFETKAQPRRDLSPVPAAHRLSRVPSDSLMGQHVRANLRRVDTNGAGEDIFSDGARTPSSNSYEPAYKRSVSPSTPQSSTGSMASVTGGRKAPPPPPPSRALKPGAGKAAPPPPPTKRSLVA